MRIIIEFDDASSPTIRLEPGAQSSVQTSASYSPAPALQGATDAGQAPAAATVADNFTSPASQSNATLMSGAQQYTGQQPGASDGGQALSAGAATAQTNNNANN